MSGSTRPGRLRRHRAVEVGPAPLRRRTPAAAEPPAPRNRRRPRAVEWQPDGAGGEKLFSLLWAPDQGEPQRGVGFLQPLDHRIQIAIQDLIKVVGLEADAMVRDAVFGEVVGADAFGKVDRPDLPPTGRE